MTREIKGRYWDSIEKRFYYWSFPGEVFIPEEYNKSNQLFVGLLDKNGENIFEGDIVEYDCENIVVEIGWMEVDAFDVYGINLVGTYKTFKDHGTGKTIQSEIEIVGNIYENQELLKK